MDDLLQDTDTENFFALADRDEQEFNSLSDELSQLYDTTIAIESFGINPTAFAIMQTTGLLSGTSLDAMAIESSFHDRPLEVQSAMAVESLLDTIKEKTARWSAKVLEITKDGATKLIAMLTPLMNKTTDLIKSFAGKAWDKTKAAGRVVKAHPYKTAAAIIAAIVAVGGILAFSASKMPGAYSNESALKTFLFELKEKITGIKYPEGRFVVSIKEGTNHRGWHFTEEKSETFRTNPGDGKLAELGWTPQFIKDLGQSLEKAWSSIRIGLTSFGQSLLKVTSSVGHGVFDKVADFKRSAPQTVYKMTGSSDAAHATSFAIGGIVYGTCISIVYAVYRLIKKIVVGGIMLLFRTLKNIQKAIEGQF